MNIYVMPVPDDPYPKGATKSYYRYVDILNSLGHRAFVVHTKPGFRCTWFENETPVVYLRPEAEPSGLRRLLGGHRSGQARGEGSRILLEGAPEPEVRPDDCLVLLAKFADRFVDRAPGTRKVIFNRGAYMTFTSLPSSEAARRVYFHPDVAAVVTVSEDSKRYLEYGFPGLRVFRHHNSFNTELFRLSEAKKRQLCFMPRKNPSDIKQVIRLLELRGALHDFEVVPIQKMSEREVARAFRESLLFLSSGHPEGFGNPPVEAMACGCLAVGYHGMGGLEFFRDEFSFPVEVGHIVEFASTVERLIALWDAEPERLMTMARRASEFVEQNYSREVERHDIENFWQGILSMNTTSHGNFCLRTDSDPVARRG